jgi:ankyrin repeat protein
MRTRCTLAVALVWALIATVGPTLTPFTHDSTAYAAAKKNDKKQRDKKKADDNKKKKPAKKALRFGKGDWREVAHPLFAAVYDGDVAQVVALLKKNKNDVDVKLGGQYADASKITGLIGGTPLIFASWKGTDRVVPFLLQAGADVKAKDRAGMTPLHWAAQYRHDKIVAQLVKAGADPTAKDKNGKTPIDLTPDDRIRAYLKKAAEKKP